MIPILRRKHTERKSENMKREKHMGPNLHLRNLSETSRKFQVFVFVFQNGFHSWAGECERGQVSEVLLKLKRERTDLEGCLLMGHQHKY